MVYAGAILGIVGEWRRWRSKSPLEGIAIVGVRKIHAVDWPRRSRHDRHSGRSEPWVYGASGSCEQLIPILLLRSLLCCDASIRCQDGYEQATTQ